MSGNDVLREITKGPMPGIAKEIRSGTPPVLGLLFAFLMAARSDPTVGFALSPLSAAVVTTKGLATATAEERGEVSLTTAVPTPAVATMAVAVTYWPTPAEAGSTAWYDPFPLASVATGTAVAPRKTWPGRPVPATDHRPQS